MTISDKSINSLIILFIISVLMLIIAFLFLGNWFTDDAFISFRYAKNFLSGKGLVYNPGEYVQGYTNFLWVILLSAGSLLSLNLTVIPIIINVFSVLFIGVISFLLTRKMMPHPSKGILILLPLLTVSSPNLLTWSIGGGLEGPFFTLLIFISFYIINNLTGRSILFAGVISGIAFLTRPEGLMFFFFYAIFIYYFSTKELRKKYLLIFSISFCLISIPYLGWCYLYYGSLIPNTFYAKFTLVYRQIFEGLHYTYSFLMSMPFALLFLILTVLNYKLLNPKIKFILFVISAYILYIIVVGGDFMFAYRFFIPIMPFIFIVIYNIINLVFKHSINIWNYRYSQTSLMILILIIYNLLSISFFYNYKTSIKNNTLVEKGKDFAHLLNSCYPTSYVIACSAIGALGYYSDRRILDIIGLTEPHIAKSKINSFTDYYISHNRSDSYFVLSKKPEIIIFGAPPGEKYPVRLADTEIFNNPIFIKNYIYKKIQYNQTEYRFYLRKSEINN